MKKIFVLILMFLLVSACTTNVKDYKPQSPDQEAINNVLIKLQESWNNKDKEGFLSVYHENAKIMAGREREILTKSELSEYLNTRLKEAGKARLSNPKIEIKNGKAIVEYNFGVSQHNILETAHLIKENGRWYIIESSY